MTDYRPGDQTATKTGDIIAADVNLATAISGEDQTNGVMVVEQGRFQSVISNGLNKVYADNTADGSATTQTSGERAGDYLHGILFIQGITWEMTGGVIVRDTTNWGGVVEQSFTFAANAGSGGTTSGVTALNAATDNGFMIPPGTFVPVGLTAVNGWAMVGGSGGVAMATQAVALIGRFSA